MQIALRDRVIGLENALLAYGSVGVQRIDNGFLVQFQTVPLPVGPGSTTTSRAVFCQTIPEVTEAVKTLMQMPWRLPAGGDTG